MSETVTQISDLVLPDTSLSSAAQVLIQDLCTDVCSHGGTEQFFSRCTDKIAPSSSEGTSIVKMALSFDKQYCSYHEVVT